MSQGHNDAILAFLSDLTHARKIRTRLFERARESPELVQQYLSTLDEEQIRGNEILLRLHKIVKESSEPPRTLQ